ncbi:hypothetical protein MMC21_001399 [Puttea exsequens]|nr:hypothetical protein [Puttea exsequens]
MTLRNPSPAPSQTGNLFLKELQRASKVVASEKIPSQSEIVDALEICQSLSQTILEPSEPPKTYPNPDYVPNERLRTPFNPISRKGPASSLLSLEESEGEKGKPEPPSPRKNEGYGSEPQPPQRPLVPADSRLADQISEMAYRIITDPKVFVTPDILASYVYTQSVLDRLNSFPEVFDLYAYKANPIPKTQPVKYRDASPYKASSAVPLKTAQAALTAAIMAKDLPLCLSIIDTTTSATAHQRQKFIRLALVPLSGLALAPIAAYILASKFSLYQQSMDPQVATNMLFLALTAYVGFTATIGFVAITTGNDQMDRITWALGTPLRDRWLREDERAMVDRVAGAWGFQDIYKRGEEEGPEWEMLREWAGTRGMILDKPDLMEGME